ncbi:excinuclease ABC subunit UvrC [uncultured Dubosiella sp.]|jgi:excinuclease ABC subunit C|uniref:excinuclease ABC subunit UvrC n=1 Tax=uncultured Dubosiella sp. TaxID=1937011 RepID=UPI0020804DAE|nr:excinuclease ABC subunit UvrC [uncultured Dubosiella sp.]GJM57341.1 UvrABC system protein C [Erysipelotrichaceae bacterium OPF54]
MAVSKHLQDKLSLLPDQPGCYIMKDEKGKILYVGKAKVLKNRVRSYFTGVHNNKTTRLVSHIRDFEYIVTGSEKEALLLEINLIKKHRPPFNIMFMDDKMYPYIEVSGEKDFQVRISRKPNNKKSRYFGPYPSSSSAYEMVKLVNQIFPIRKCRHLGRQECLYYHMHQCLAPCVRETDPKVQAAIKSDVVRFLKGDMEDVLKSLRAKMQAAAEELQFERAKELRDQILHIEHIKEKQSIDFSDRTSRDVFGYYEDKGYISFYGFFIRDGKLLERTLSITPIYEDVEEAFISFIVQYYASNTKPKEILVPKGTDIQALENALDVKVRIPERGEKKKLVDLVVKNAREAHDQKFQLLYKKDKELDMAMQHLSRIIGRPVHTIESFDNSHIQGTNNVSALVVFEDGRPNKAQYRHYQLGEYRSDIDSMKEVVYRRYFRLLREGKPMPDVLIVDGGAAQINAAKSVRDELMLDLPIAGLVKDERHSTRALMLEDLEEVPLNKEDPLFFMLTRLQDEVHRFAIDYHRKLRSKGMTRSILDEVSGIGDVRKKEIMKHFKSMKALKEATIEQIGEVVPLDVARRLYDRLHPAD